jgi:hypothetical protein
MTLKESLKDLGKDYQTLEKLHILTYMQNQLGMRIKDYTNFMKKIRAEKDEIQIRIKQVRWLLGLN